MPIPLLAGPAASIGLSLLKRFWPYILAAAIVGGGVWYWQHLERKVEQLERENETLVVERDAWKESYGDLKVGLEEQTKLLKGVAKQGEQLQKDFAGLNTNVNARIGKLSTTLSEIKNQDLSKLTDKQAIDYLRDAALKRQKKVPQ
jgi:ABC-type phosphate transport system auxiliary subunit